MSAKKSAFFRALTVYADVSNTATRNLREAALAAGFNTYEEAHPACLEWASQNYNVPLIVSQSPRNKGETALDSKAPAYQAAKTALRRVREALTGDADAPAKTGAQSGKSEVEVPAEIAALAAKLVAMCNEYEKAKKLAAQAIAEAFAAK